MISPTHIESTARPTPAPGLGRVLVATDLSPRSECALTRATHLPLRPGAEMILLHVGPEASPGPEEAWQVEHALRETIQRVGRPCARQEVQVRGELRTGTPVEQIADAARELGAELVVMGRPRRPASFLGLARERIMGGLLHKVSTALLVAVSHPARAYRRPLVAVDLGGGAHRAFQRALQLCPKASRATAVHLYDASYELVLHFAGSSTSQQVEYLRRAEQLAHSALHAWAAPYREAGLQVEEVVGSGEPAEVLLEAAAVHHADLIVLGRNTRTGLGRLIRPHVAERVVRDSPCDVLVLELEPESGSIPTREEPPSGSPS